MNIYYWLAIGCGAIAALMTYLGQKHEGEKQSSQVQEVRQLLSETRGILAEAKSSGTPVAAEDFESLEDRYAVLAEKFQTERPRISAQISARKASREAEQVTSSAELLDPVRVFTKEATKIAAAFSKDTVRWIVQLKDMPDNVISVQSAHFVTYAIEGGKFSYIGKIFVHKYSFRVTFTRVSKPIEYWESEYSLPAELIAVSGDSIDVRVSEKGAELECGDGAVDVCDLVRLSEEYKTIAGPDEIIPRERFGEALIAVFLGTIRHELAVMDQSGPPTQ